jgi:hypothetical protein
LSLNTKAIDEICFNDPHKNNYHQKNRLIEIKVINKSRGISSLQILALISWMINRQAGIF